MHNKTFVFYLPYIPKKNQQKNISHAIATKTAKHFYWGHSVFHFYILFQRFCQLVSKFLGEIFCQLLDWRYSNAPRYVWCTVATFYWNSKMYPLGAQILLALIWPCWLTVFGIKRSNWSLITYYNSSNIHCQPIKSLHVWAKRLAPWTCFEHLPDLLNRSLLKVRMNWCIKQLDHFVFFWIFMWKKCFPTSSVYLKCWLILSC